MSDDFFAQMQRMPTYAQLAAQGGTAGAAPANALLPPVSAAPGGQQQPAGITMPFARNALAPRAPQAPQLAQAPAMAGMTAPFAGAQPAQAAAPGAAVPATMPGIAAPLVSLPAMDGTGSIYGGGGQPMNTQRLTRPAPYQGSGG